jgi:hypothetical protein
VKETARWRSWLLHKSATARSETQSFEAAHEAQEFEEYFLTAELRILRDLLRKLRLR